MPASDARPSHLTPCPSSANATLADEVSGMAKRALLRGRSHASVRAVMSEQVFHEIARCFQLPLLLVVQIDRESRPQRVDR